jgi:hypothetical protein
MLGSSEVAAQLAASQEGLSSINDDDGGEEITVFNRSHKTFATCVRLPRSYSPCS